MAKNYSKSNNNNQNFKRKTGCKSTTYRNGDGETRQMYRAWRPDPFAKSGWQNVICVPLHDPTPKNGSEIYQKWVATITDSMGKRKYNAILNTHKRTMTIPDLGLLLSPNGQGYFGPIKRS